MLVTKQFWWQLTSISQNVFCFEEQSESYRFGMTGGWVNDDRIGIFWVNYPFNVITTQMKVKLKLCPKSQNVLLLGCSDVLEGQKRECGSLRKKISHIISVIQHKASFKESLLNSVSLVFFVFFVLFEVTFTELSESTKQRNNKRADWKASTFWHREKTT